MGNTLHVDKAAEKEATDIGAKFMHSSDVVGDMSRAYGRDLSSVRIHTDESAARGAAERGVDAFSTGKDVFFARGAFDRSDPASRGLLAHELSHSMQQGVGGGAPALTQSAPMGAEQGGLREWFREHFGKSGDGEEPAPEEIPAANEAAPEPEPAALAQGAAEMDAQPNLIQNNDPQSELRGAAEELETFKKRELPWNYVKYKRITAAIDTSIEKLYTRLSGNPAEDRAILDDVVASFDELISACEDYLSRNPNTSKGWHRQEIVRQVLNIAVKDRVGFVMQAPDGMEEYSTAMDILTRSRQRTLQLAQGKEKDLQHVGGAASYIAKIEKGMLTDRNASGFFKQEENFTVWADPKHILLDALESAKQKTALSEEQYEAIKAVILEKGALDNAENDLPDYNSNRTVHEAVSMIQQFSGSYMMKNFNIQSPLKFNESLSLSKRNVATSRLAELLGLGDLVARSETATLVDADGTSRSGNLMQAAEGQEVQGYIVDQYRDQYANERKKQSGKSDVHLNANMDDKVTPEFLKSLMALQVLDNLAGQVDRHAGNYFSRIKDGKLGKVQAIDNDFSFDQRTLRWEDNTNSIGTHGKNILNKDGTLNVPYMDRALADRITVLDEQVLRDVMADVLEPWAIDALCVRFQQVKNAIQKDQENNSDRYLEQDSDWGRKEVFDTLRNGYQERGGWQTPTNYVSYLLMSADLSNEKVESSLNFRGYLDDDYKERLCAAVLMEAQNMGDEEKAKAHLKAYGVQDRVLSYLEATGQLLDGPALLKRLPYTDLQHCIENAIMDLQSKKGQTS